MKSTLNRTKARRVTALARDCRNLLKCVPPAKPEALENYLMLIGGQHYLLNADKRPTKGERVQYEEQARKLELKLAQKAAAAPSDSAEALLPPKPQRIPNFIVAAILAGFNALRARRQIHTRQKTG